MNSQNLTDKNKNNHRSIHDTLPELLSAFDPQFHTDIQLGIERALVSSGDTLTVRAFIDKLNLRIDEIEIHLRPMYRTPTGRALGSSGRRELICAICLSDESKKMTILE